MQIVKHRKIFYIISVALVLSSVLAVIFWGLKPGVDFSGGSLLNVSFEGNKPTVEEVNQILGSLNLGDASARTSDEGYIFRFKEITQAEKDSILSALSAEGEYKPAEKTFSTIGPVLGKEALQKSWISIILVLSAIVLFIAFAFRKVSKPVSSWVYGLVTISALTHDVLIPTGVFAFLGHFYGFEVDTLFVTALLVILGFSVHDTIVVFDRVRENLHRNEESKEKDKKPARHASQGDAGGDFETIVGESISQTLIRSINTSLTTLLAIFILYLFGPETIKNFSLALLIGIFIGTYSSIFIGSPLLVTINGWKK